MSARATLALLLILLTACGQKEQRVNESRSWIPRRSDAAFAEERPKPSAERLADADEVDAMEALFADGRDGECRQRLADYFAKQGDHPRAHDLNGQLLALEQRYSEASEAFTRAVAGSPRWLQPRLSLAECYLEMHRPAAASSVYAEIDRLMPQAPWGPWGQGLIAAQGEQRDRAIAFLDEALRRDPRHPPSLRIRAVLAERAGDAALAEQLWLRYVAQVSNDPNAWSQLGSLAESAGRLVDAQSHFERAYDLSPQPRLAQRIATIAERRGDAQAAATWSRLTAP